MKNIIAGMFIVSSIATAHAQWAGQTSSSDLVSPINRTGMISIDTYNSAQLRLNSNGTYYGKIGNPSSQVWSLGWGTWTTDINPVFSWNASGNVGIGTTTPINKLEVDIASSNTNYGSVGSADLGLYLKNTSATNNNLNIISFGDASGYGIAHVGAVIKDHTNHSGNLFFATKPSGSPLLERMRIDEAGNVGIGTTSPAGKLDINAGSQYAIRTLTSSRYVIEVRNTSDTDGGWWLVNDPNGNFALHENSVGDQFTIKPGGNVGIGTTTPDAKLAVAGQVHAQEVKVSITVPGPDYVFEKDYKLTSLEEIKNYIDQNKHLPEVPSAKEMEKNGVQLGEMNMLLLKKIEELTLYVIEQNKKIEDQNKKIDLQGQEINTLKNKSK